MWSDTIAPARLEALVAQLHKVIPAPSPRASSNTVGLRGRASVDQVAELLRREPGFAWVHATTGSPAAIDPGSVASHLLRRPLATISYSDGRGTIASSGGTVQIEALGFDILQAAFAAWQGPAGGHLTGFLSYELATEIEDVGTLPPATFPFPKFHFGLYDSALVSRDGTWSLFGTDAWRGGDGLPFSLTQAEDLIARASTFVASNDGPSVVRPDSLQIHQSDRVGFEAAVERIVAAIHTGDIFQTNLCRCINAPLEPAAEWELFQRMRAINPSRYEAFLRVGDDSTNPKAVLSISPELFLKVNGRVVESEPIKGTRPRGKGAAEDQKLSAQLISSEKDRAELAMIVDVVRNDLGRVCETGSIKVVQHAELMSLPTVHHLFSTVQGRLREPVGPIQLLRAAFPAASISGAPKIEAIRVAMREEGRARGPCMGAVGWIALDGSLEMSVAIRTAFVTDGVVRYYAGCGITAESNPGDEYVESQHKASAFVHALQSLGS